MKAVRYEGAERSRPAPGVLEALADADAIVLCPSNPVASLGPILAVPGIRGTLGARRNDVVGVSGIVAGAPLAGMADRLMPAAGAEVTAAGAAEYYRGSWAPGSSTTSTAHSSLGSRPPGCASARPTRS